MSLRDVLQASTPQWSTDARADASAAAEHQPWWVGSLDRELWLVVVWAMLADVALTLYGLEMGLVEHNPVARSAIAGFGGLGLLGLKAVAIGIGLCCWAVLPARYRPAIPLGLAVPTLVAVVSNAMLVTSATL